MDAVPISVAIHTLGGVHLFAFGPEHQVDLTWTRAWREVSRCDLKVPGTVVSGQLHLPLIVPWLHWCSVWGAGEVLWTGPIQKVTVDVEFTTINAVDIGALLARTRVPITKRWDATRPENIAAELWTAMIANHGLDITPLVLPDPEGDAFDFEVETDARMLDQVNDDLVNLGLSWTVVAGTPLLGVAVSEPPPALGMDDFIGAGIQLVRDGTRTYNDILVRGAGADERTRISLHGLNLQTLVTIDSLEGISSVERAVRQYARYTAGFRDSLVLTGNTVLHPDAPVLLSQLIPSARFIIQAYDMAMLMSCEGIEVRCSAGAFDVSVSMEAFYRIPIPGVLPGAAEHPELWSVVEGGGKTKQASSSKGGKR